MAPLIPIFDASALPEHVNFTTKNFQPKLRKGTPVELEKCPLFEMEQFACHAPATVGGRPVCLPVIRLFRRCAGGLTVETTAWERLRIAEEEKKSSSGEKGSNSKP